jgi:5-dehydro-2-deoxygluconokinase
LIIAARLKRECSAGGVREWLMTAAGVPRFIGFAVGWTDFWEPLVSWLAKKVARDVAVAKIAYR